MGRAPKQLIIKNNNQSINSADNLTAWIHRDPHMWITRLLAVGSRGGFSLRSPLLQGQCHGSVVSEAAPASCC